MRKQGATTRGIVLIHLVVALGIVRATEVHLEVPLVRQKQNGCGAATVVMVARYWASQLPGVGHQANDVGEVHEQLYSAEAGGVRLSEMKVYFQERGFHAFTLRASWADLEDHLSKLRPVIACLKKGPRAPLHYAVLVGLEGKRVLLNDPARRKPQRLKRSAFEKRWNLADRWVLLAVPRQ